MPGTQSIASFYHAIQDQTLDTWITLSFHPEAEGDVEGAQRKVQVEFQEENIVFRFFERIFRPASQKEKNTATVQIFREFLAEILGDESKGNWLPQNIQNHLAKLETQGSPLTKERVSKCLIQVLQSEALNNRKRTPEINKNFLRNQPINWAVLEENNRIFPVPENQSEVVDAYLKKKVERHSDIFNNNDFFAIPVVSSWDGPRKEKCGLRFPYLTSRMDSFISSRELKIQEKLKLSIEQALLEDQVPTNEPAITDAMRKRYVCDCFSDYESMICSCIKQIEGYSQEADIVYEGITNVRGSVMHLLYELMLAAGFNEEGTLDLEKFQQSSRLHFITTLVFFHSLKSLVLNKVITLDDGKLDQNDTQRFSEYLASDVFQELVQQIQAECKDIGDNISQQQIAEIAAARFLKVS